MTKIRQQRRPVEVGPTWALRRHEVALILAGWSIVGVISVGQQLAMLAQEGVEGPLAEAVLISFAYAFIWALTTIVIFSVSRRFPLDRKPRLRNIAIHAALSLVIASGESALEMAAAIGMGRLGPDDLLNAWLLGIPIAIVVYWLAVGVAHGMMFYRRYRQRDEEAAMLSNRLAQAELQVLKSQLHPHFLFNALNTISALMHRDVKAADRMLSRLSELLRGALDHTSDQEVSLQDELAFLSSYLEIEKARLAERLTVQMDVPSNVLDARVPHMILQPLVENAIRHGVSPRAVPGTVTIRARGRRGMLDLEVIDDGPGVQPKRLGNGSGGLGLSNTRSRLEQLYGERFTFVPKNRDGGGYRVSMSIPFRSITQAIDEEEEGQET
jgi:two-component system LytT family sensor kinase